MSNPLLLALIAHCDSVFYGPNGDYQSILEVISKISYTQAVWKPLTRQNSIWQIVEHLIASKEWLISILDQQNPAPIVWGEPSGAEPAWQDTLVRLKDAHQQLKKQLEMLSDSDLLKIPNLAENQTLLELILSSGPAHEAHHSGQIDYLRGLQAGMG